MRDAVDLNNKTCGGTIEINDITTQRDLPAKLHVCNLVAAQGLPKQAFGWRRRTARFAGVL
jgi:hypothetical protein